MPDDKVTQQDIEDTFNRVWFVLEDFLDAIHGPVENEFATKQLEKFRDSVNALASKRNRFPFQAELGFDLQASSQHQLLPLIDKRSLPTPCLNNSIVYGLECDISASQSMVINTEPFRDQDVENSMANQISRQVHTSLPTIAPRKRPTRGSTTSETLHAGTTSRHTIDRKEAKFEDLTFSIMNVSYLTQLRANMVALRTNTSSKHWYESEDVAIIFQGLETIGVTHCFIKRLLLFRLASIRDKIVHHVRCKRKAGVKPEHGARKPEDQALDILVETIHKHTKRNMRQLSLWREEFEGERTNIKNKLHAARVWKTLAREFGLAILILVPWSGQKGSLNNRYQKPKNEVHKRLCHSLRLQDDGIIQEIAHKLNPFAEAVSKGRPPPRLRIEDADTIFQNVDRSVVMSLFEESPDS